MDNILAQIYKHKLIEVRNRKKTLSVPEICAKTKCLNAPRNFYEALKTKNDKKELALICEIKRGSPSAGIINKNLNVALTARNYQEMGATCISVLTDEKYFYSHDNFLIEAKNSCSLPILRKDFMVDSYQIYESKMLGADCILLIVAMLDDKKLQELEQVALDIGLSVLVEIHNYQELERALKLKSKLIGINNRDLKTLKIDLNTTLELKKFIPNDRVLVCESGIKSSAEIDNFRTQGVNCFLIGEFFMRGGKIN
ncbi:MAG: indole-3-glycerol phosphate synthase TrpC [Proteobacteria bacterium]|nr:indole-3-glycerol phosphate synthase TrpC [Pseudomonadota bacterium]NCA28448.1 indole-3-glycerol phosphate synthase TrpC [Pseudomonadota bacterium]